MGLRCSLTGHTFGDSEVEREREERGDEVVVTVREYKTCSRCGERKVVTENKEVTSIAEGDDGGDTSQQNGTAPAGRNDPPVSDRSTGRPGESGTDADYPDTDGPSPDHPGADRPESAGAGDDGSRADVQNEAPPDDAPGDDLPDDAPDDDLPDDDAVLLDEGDADASGAERQRPPDAAAADGPEREPTAPEDASATGPRPGSEPDDVVEEAEPAPDDDAAPVESDDPPRSGATDGRMPGDEEEATPSPPDGDEPVDVDGSDRETDAPDDRVVDDDGIILDEDADDGDRAYGEWPEREDQVPPEDSEPTDWPEKDPADEGFDATTPESGEPDVEVEGITGSGDADGDAGGDSEGTPGADTEDGSGYDTEEEKTPPDDDAVFIDPDPEPSEIDDSSGFTSAGSAPAPDQRKQQEGSGRLVCPECGTTAKAKASLRVGDICPDCKRGYLTDEERNK